MTELIDISKFQPVVSVDNPPEITVDLLKCAAIELRKSPNFLSYIQKLHLTALADLATIKVVNSDDSDIKATYARLRERIKALEGILEIPHLAEQHQEVEL